jgi:hypothetical protein
MATIPLTDTATTDDVTHAHNRAYYRDHGNKVYGENLTYRWVGLGAAYLLDLDNDAGYHLNVGGVLTVTDSGATLNVALTASNITAGAGAFASLLVTPGTTSLSALTAGAATLNSLTVTTSASVGSLASSGSLSGASLLVTPGTTSLSALTAGNTSVGTLATSGLYTANAGITVASGTTTLGVTNAGATTLTGLTVTPNTSTLSALVAGATSVTTLATSGLYTASAGITIASGSLTALATGVTTLSSSGLATLNSLAVTPGDSSVVKLTASGLITGTAGLTISSGSTTIAGTLTAQANFLHTGSAFAFFNSAAQTKQTITGSRGGNAALANLLSALANHGMITDSTTA